MKITKIAISRHRMDRSLRNLVCSCKMSLLTALSVKNSNFTNPRWRTAAILKTVILPYLCNRLTDFDKIWHGDACWSPAPDVKFKFHGRCRRSGRSGHGLTTFSATKIFFCYSLPMKVIAQPSPLRQHFGSTWLDHFSVADYDPEFLILDNLIRQIAAIYSESQN